MGIHSSSLLGALVALRDHVAQRCRVAFSVKSSLRFAIGSLLRKILSSSPSLLQSRDDSLMNKILPVIHASPSLTSGIC
jgi:hypothetical protein